MGLRGCWGGPPGPPGLGKAELNEARNHETHADKHHTLTTTTNNQTNYKEGKGILHPLSLLPLSTDRSIDRYLGTPPPLGVFYFAPPPAQLVLVPVAC